MATVPPPTLFDPKQSRAAAERFLSTARQMVEETRNQGLAVLARCAKERGGSFEDDARLALLVPLRHVLEMLDGVGVLADAGAAVPAKLQLRSLYEGHLTVAFILQPGEIESQRQRCFDYLASDVRRRISDLQAWLPHEGEPARVLTVLKRDAQASLLLSRMPELASPEALSQELEAWQGRLAELGYRGAQERYLMSRRALKKRRVQWYEQGEGAPQSIRELSTVLGLAGWYELIYRSVSNLAHAGDSAGVRAEELLRPIRDPAELGLVVGFAVVLTVRTCRLVLEAMRPDDVSLKRWFEEEIGDWWARLNSAHPGILKATFRMHLRGLGDEP